MVASCRVKKVKVIMIWHAFQVSNTRNGFSFCLETYFWIEVRVVCQIKVLYASGVKTNLVNYWL